MNIQFGIPPNSVSVSNLIQQYLQQVALQADQQVKNFSRASGEKILHGQSPTLLDLYA